MQGQDIHAPSDHDEVTDQDVTPLDEDDDAETRGNETRGLRRYISTIPARVWIAVAVACLIASFVCLLSGNPSAAFVVGVLGVLAWFLNVRAQLRNAHQADEAERDDD